MDAAAPMILFRSLRPDSIETSGYVFARTISQIVPVSKTGIH